MYNYSTKFMIYKHQNILKCAHKRKQTSDVSVIINGVEPTALVPLCFINLSLDLMKKLLIILFHVT